MAKRGYRGKHPHNDMKVSKNPSSGKHSAKLTKEYNNLKNDKTRYDYIRTHYFYPQGSLTLSASKDLAAANQITMSSADGVTVELVGAGATSAADGEFKADGTAANATDGMVSCINTLSAGKLTAVNSSDQLVVTQNEPGPDGNTTVTFSTDINNKVFIAGTTVQSSGSVTYKFSGG